MWLISALYRRLYGLYKLYIEDYMPYISCSSSPAAAPALLQPQHCYSPSLATAPTLLSSDTFRDLGSQELPEAPRGSQGLPGTPTGSQVLPGVPRGSQRFPEAPRGFQGLPEAPRSSQGLPGAPRGSQRLPGVRRGSQGLPGAFRGS